MKNKNRDCKRCSECVYVGEGDFVCMLNMPPIIVIENFVPTNDFGDCEKPKERA